MWIDDNSKKIPMASTEGADNNAIIGRRSVFSVSEEPCRACPRASDCKEFEMACDLFEFYVDGWVDVTEHKGDRVPGRNKYNEIFSNEEEGGNENENS